MNHLCSFVDMPKAEADWSKLPKDVLISIFDRLPIGDFLRSCVVCTWWHSAAYVDGKDVRLGHETPWLMIPYIDHFKNGTLHRCFSISECRQYFIHIPHTKDNVFVGSSMTNGWVVMLDPTDDLYAINPITRTRFDLPSIASLPYIHGASSDGHTRRYLYDNRWRQIDEVIKKVIVTSLPSSRMMVVFIEYFAEHLSIARAGDKSWTILKGEKPQQNFVDVAFLKGHLYAIDRQRNLFSCKIDDDSASCPTSLSMIEMFSIPPKRRSFITRDYLVACEDTLFQVNIFVNQSIERIEVSVQVMKLDFEAREWSEVRSLDGHVFFLGSNYSTALVADDFPELKGNCIYFNHLLVTKVEVTCAYNIEDEKVEWFYPRERVSQFDQPVWFTPTL